MWKHICRSFDVVACELCEHSNLLPLRKDPMSLNGTEIPRTLCRINIYFRNIFSGVKQQPYIHSSKEVQMKVQNKHPDRLRNVSFDKGEDILTYILMKTTARHKRILVIQTNDHHEGQIGHLRMLYQLFTFCGRR